MLKLYAHLGPGSKQSDLAAFGGIGLLRTDFLLEETGLHPDALLKEKRLEKVLHDGIAKYARAMYPRPVWVRTMDLSPSELKAFHGGDKEGHEKNPLLGLRGVARSLEAKEWFEAEVKAVKKLLGEGLNNIGIFFPMVRTLEDYREAKIFLERLGLVPHQDIKVGTMFETPSATLTCRSFVAEGLDFAFIGVNDLTQYTLAADRDNAAVESYFNPAHPSLLAQYNMVLRACQEKGIETSMSYHPALLEHVKTLVSEGLTSITVTPKYFSTIERLFAYSSAKL